jgi:drug/metabolite transporter (DMT)-like permease
LASSLPRDWLSAVELVMLGAIWGGSFLFMRVAAPHFGPVPLVQVRLTLGAVVLLPFLWRVRTRLSAAHWGRFFIVGALSSALPFVLFAWGAERAPAGIGAIANSMTVLFTALVAFAAFGERIGTRRAIALVAGFVGVVVLASGKTAGADVGLAALAGTLASLCYGMAANLIKRYMADLPPGAVAAGTLLCATLMVAPLAAATWPVAPVPPSSWACAIALGVLCTGIAYAVYFRLIQRIGASRASTSTYLVPLFGVAWAWLFLGEPLTLTMAASGALILGSVILSQKPARRSP